MHPLLEEAQRLMALTPAQALALQRRLRGRVVLQDQLGPLRRVAGMDVSYNRHAGVARAAIALLSLPHLQLIEWSYSELPISFPYVPGLLAFRELPALLHAFVKLQRQPDLILCDGHGLAHPRRFGLACHLGVLLDRPCIGVAKRVLVGAHAPLAAARGSWQPLKDEEEILGIALRTRGDVSPVYISVGHRVSLETARELVLQLAPTYRLPEPLRQAHRLASQRPPQP
jgi:deoxyribonuclease V